MESRIELPGTQLESILLEHFKTLLQFNPFMTIKHSYTASENVLVAPGDGKFQTLIKKFNYFHQV